MQSSVLYGISEPNEEVVRQLRVQCPSQNCTWPEPYTSLSVCSRCKDITGQMRETEPGWSTPIALDLELDAPGCNKSIPVTRFTLPNGAFIDGSNGWAYNSRTGT